MSRARAQTVTTTPPARTAVLYVRVSSKEKEQGFSIPAQRKLLIEYAGQHRLNVVREFEDVETAGRPNPNDGLRQASWELSVPSVWRSDQWKAP